MMDRTEINTYSWHGALKSNPYCEDADMNLYGAIQLTQVLFTRFGAGTDMDLLIDLPHEKRVMAVVTELLNIASLNNEASQIIKDTGLIGYYHRYVTNQL